MRLCEQLEQGDIDRTLFRKLGKYAVNVWPHHLEKLQSVGTVLAIGQEETDEENCFVLRDMTLYSSRLGLKFQTPAQDAVQPGRIPYGMRGLKYDKRVRPDLHYRSYPIWDTCIEMIRF